MCHEIKVYFAIYKFSNKFMTIASWRSCWCVLSVNFHFPFFNKIRLFNCSRSFIKFVFNCELFWEISDFVNIYEWWRHTSIDVKRRTDANQIEIRIDFYWTFDRSGCVEHGISRLNEFVKKKNVSSRQFLCAFYHNAINRLDTISSHST